MREGRRRTAERTETPHYTRFPWPGKKAAIDGHGKDEDRNAGEDQRDRPFTRLSARRCTKASARLCLPPAAAQAMTVFASPMRLTWSNTCRH